MKKLLFSGLLFFSLLALLPLTQVYAERTIIDNERAIMTTNAFAVPQDQNPFSGVAAYLGFWKTTPKTWSDINQQGAIRISQGRFQHLRPGDDQNFIMFPYTQLRKLEQEEVAKGHTPFFLTANYQNQNRPLLFAYTLQLPTDHPRSLWSQLVNYQDARYVQFWINEFARKTAWRNVNGYPDPNMWIGIDNGFFFDDADITKPMENWTRYGVIDDNVLQTPSYTTWNAPAPVTRSAYLNNIKEFNRLRLLYAPDSRLIINAGGNLSDPKLKEDGIFGPGGFEGIMTEGYFSVTNLDYLPKRKEFYSFYNLFKWFGTQPGKVVILRDVLPNRNGSFSLEDLETSYMAYLIVKGDNFFYNAAQRSGTKEVDPKFVLDMKNVLGQPTGPAVEDPPENSSPFTTNKLYTRRYEGGMVYLNLKGSSQPITIPIPTDRTYYDENGTQISGNITINDKQGRFIKTVPGMRVETLAINPRFDQPISEKVEVKLSATAPATIYYTTDGNDPTTASTEYTSPIRLTQTTTIRAKAFPPEGSGLSESFTNSATYTITPNLPTISFAPNQSGSELLSPNYALVKLSNPSGEEVKVKVVAETSSTAPATPDSDYTFNQTELTFAPGQIYKYVPITIINDTSTESDEQVQLKLVDPINGIADNQHKNWYVYTITDNDGLNLPPFKNTCPYIDDQILANTPKVTTTIQVDEEAEYRIWLRVRTPNRQTTNSVWVQVDDRCPANFGGPIVISPTSPYQWLDNEWYWLSATDGDIGQPLTPLLSPGTHTITIIKEDSGLQIDRMAVLRNTRVNQTDNQCDSKDLNRPEVQDACLIHPVPAPGSSPSPTPSPSPSATSSPSPSPSPSAFPSPSPSVSPSPSPSLSPSPAASPSPSPSPFKKGDLDHDGDVDLADFNTFARYYRDNDLRADFNGNGKVDLADLNLLIRNFGK